MEIRKATSKDAKIICDFYLALCDEEQQYLPANIPVYQHVDDYKQQTLNDIKERLSDEWFFIVEIDGVPIGYAHGHRLKDTASHVYSDSALLAWMYVLTAYRRRGVAKALFEEFLAAVKKQGDIRQIRLHTFIHNPAVRLYEQLGFVPTTYTMDLPVQNDLNNAKSPKGA